MAGHSLTLPQTLGLGDEEALGFDPDPGLPQNLDLGISDADVSAVAQCLSLKGCTDLNREQKQAIAAMLCGAGRQLPFVLFGPPGVADG